MRALTHDLVIVTDDGSYGRQALVTAPYKVPTIVSLNPIMVDGTGMCGGCRVPVGGKTKFTCVDEPEFDGHQVGLANLLSRLGAYKDQEERARHACKLDAVSK
jgi:ferredoxin--NADP+ reductase